MIVRLSAPNEKISDLVTTYQTRETNFVSCQHFPEKISEIRLKTDSPDPEVLFQYAIFPECMLKGFGQWELENRTMQAGDVLIQQVYLPPFKRISIKGIMTVRIREVVVEPTRIGFTYETLKGHVEQGQSGFWFLKDELGWKFRIHTFSRTAWSWNRPFEWLTTRPYQRYCTRKALKRIERMV